MPAGSPGEWSYWVKTSSSRVIPIRLTRTWRSSEAYVQFYQNACDPKEKRAIEDNMKLALKEAREASLLDADSEDAQNAVRAASADSRLSSRRNDVRGGPPRARCRAAAAHAPEHWHRPRPTR